MALTAGAVTGAPWWAVLIVSTTGGALGMLPAYAVARWAMPPHWPKRIENSPHLERYGRWARKHMFLLQVLLTTTPTPRLVSCGLAGLARYSIVRFLLAQAIGQGIHNAILVVGGIILERNRWFVRFEDLARRPLIWLLLVAITGVVWLVRRVTSSRARSSEWR
jgi:membrane protein DedA with SNARE-associated domain